MQGWEEMHSSDYTPPHSIPTATGTRNRDGEELSQHFYPVSEGHVWWVCSDSTDHWDLQTPG